MTLELTAADARLTVDPEAGARAATWSVAGTELLGHADDAEAGTPVGWGMYVMAPWPGRLRHNTVRFDGQRYPMPPGPAGWALHGTVLDRSWEVESVTGSTVTLGVALEPPWPWAGLVTVTWELRATELETTLEITSADATFPAGVGWHPWFRRRLDRGGPVRLELPGDSMLERGPDHLPTGRLLGRRPPGPYDDAFPLPDGSAALVWPGALRLECRTDCRYVVAFDEHAGAVCLEPQTTPPDGLNTQPELVAPGAPLRARSTWSWSEDRT